MTQPRHVQPMLPADTFRDQTIVITGGGTGLGRSMGQYLLSLGANLAICGRRREVVEKTAAEMSPTGGVLAWAATSRQPEQVEAMLAAVRERFGHDSRPGQQRGRQLHLSDRATVVQRLQLGRRHRAQGNLQLHAGRRQTLDRRKNAGRRF